MPWGIILDEQLTLAPEYHRAFGRCAIAFVLTLVDFRVSANGKGFDLIPDVVGYILFATAAGSFLQLHKDARIMRTLSWSLIGISTIFLVADLAGASGGFLIFLGIVELVLDLIMVWMLCGIVADLAMHVQDAQTAKSARARALFYVLIGPIITIIVLAAVASVDENDPDPSSFAAALLLVFVIVIVLIVLMVGLMRRAERLCTRQAS